MELLNPKLLLKINQEVKLIANKIGYNNVLIHSEIKHLFFFEFNSKIDLLEKHLQNIKDVFPEFNIWMTSFNYDFTKTGIYNTKEDKSQVGVLNISGFFVIGELPLQFLIFVETVNIQLIKFILKRL